MLNNDYLRKQKNLAARKGNATSPVGAFGGAGALGAESQETIAQIEEQQMKQKWRRYYISYALHMTIPLFGTYIFIFVMISTVQ